MNVDKSEPVDLYMDYLQVTTGYTTTTDLLSLADEIVSHDKTTRLFKGELYNLACLRKASGPIASWGETYDKCLSTDNSMPVKPYPDEYKLICRHWNHVKNRSAKGADFITAFYRHRGGNVPLATGSALKSRIYPASLRAGFMDMDKSSTI